jgi:hypothetical protein
MILAHLGFHSDSWKGRRKCRRQCSAAPCIHGRPCLGSCEVTVCGVGLVAGEDVGESRGGKGVLRSGGEGRMVERHGHGMHAACAGGAWPRPGLVVRGWTTHVQGVGPGRTCWAWPHERRSRDATGAVQRHPGVRGLARAPSHDAVYFTVTVLKIA